MARGVRVREQRDRVVAGALVPADRVFHVVREPRVLGDRRHVQRLFKRERFRDARMQRARLGA